MMPDDLAKQGKYFETPNYKHAKIKPHMDEWDLPYDRAVGESSDAFENS